jgi:hypothetical protein
MLYYWKSGKKKIAYDTVSGAVISLTSLEYKMIQAITPPLSPLCPSSLRYELAKFDSADVEEAYGNLYELFSRGILWGVSADSMPKICIGGSYGLNDADDLAREVLAQLSGHTPEWIVSQYADTSVTERIKALL